MVAKSLKLVYAFALLSVATVASAEMNDKRAFFHYQMFCQGCHTPNAIGKGDVPRMNNFIGHFLTVEGGREYLVQVPGSANAAVSDDHLAELLNWIILEYGGESVPSDFKPYQSAEVSELRKSPLFETVDIRAALVEQMKLPREIVEEYAVKQ